MKFSSKKFLFFVFLSLVFLALVLFTIKLFATSGIALLEHNPQAMDYLAFYTGAGLLYQNPTELYNLHSQMMLQQQIAPSIKSLHIFLPFLNPPFVALFFLPFAILPLLFSYSLWLIINIFFLGTICYLAIKHCSPSSLIMKIAICIGVASCIPVLTSLLIGQLSILLSLIVLGIWIFWKKDGEFQSGLLISLMLIKPHFFILPFLAILLQRRRKVILGMLAGIVVLFGTSYFLVGWSGMYSYFLLLQNAVAWDSGYGIDIKAQHSLQTVLLFLSGNQSLQIIRMQWYICIAIIAVPTLYLWTKQYKCNSIQSSLQWAVLLLATLLTSPHTHFHDLTLVTIVGIIIASLLTRNTFSQKNHLRIFLLFGYIIALAGFLAEEYIHPSPRPGWIIITVTYLLFFWGFLVRMIYTMKKS